MRYEYARDMWITEGGADLMAVRALKAIDPVYDDRAELQREVDDCVRLAAGRPLASAGDRGDNRAYYACGAVFGLVIEGAERRAGGVLLMVDDDRDPYNHVREWWNDNGRNGSLPRQHLFGALGLTDAELDAIVRDHAVVRGGLLPALHAVQHRAGHVPTRLVPVLADAFNISVAEVHGVISFYHDYRDTPPAELVELAATSPYSRWPVYQGSDSKTHYTTLDQISPANVANLKVAWTYDTKDAFPGSEMQSNPIVIDGVMYVTSGNNEVYAFDARTDVHVSAQDLGMGRVYWEGLPLERWKSRVTLSEGTDYRTDYKNGAVSSRSNTRSGVTIRGARRPWPRQAKSRAAQQMPDPSWEAGSGRPSRREKCQASSRCCSMPPP